MVVMTKDVLYHGDALDWVAGYCLRRPMSRVGILCASAHEARVLFGTPLGNIAFAQYLSSQRRIEFENKSVITLYNALEPDQLRGPRFDAALVQEHAGSTQAEINLQYALRLGSSPPILKYVRT